MSLKKKHIYPRCVYFLYSFLCYIMSSAYLFYICRKTPMLRIPLPQVINRQYVVPLQKRVCLKSSKSARALSRKKHSSVSCCVLIIASASPEGFLVCCWFVFFFFGSFLCFLWQGKEKKPPLRQFHGQCFNYKTCYVFAFVSASV